jgi:hypothetical protein
LSLNTDVMSNGLIVRRFLRVFVIASNPEGRKLAAPSEPAKSVQSNGRAEVAIIADSA